VNAFFFYLVCVILGAGGQAPAQTAQAQPQDQQSVHPKFSATEISKLRASAEGGDASAQFNLGKAYEDGNGVPHNDESAVNWYRKAADQGNADAENRLGVMYRIGQGVSRDKEEAVRWYHKAAKQGNPQAMFNLGASYYNGDGVAADPNRSYAWFLVAQEAGNPAAQDAVKRSAEEGGRMGTPDALLLVGAMYEKGDDLPQNYSEAAKWYRKAADLSPEAGVNLASMLIDARGVPQDYGQAMTLCQHAAKQGYAPGQFCVGYLHQRGLGTRANIKEAAKWYELASRRRFRPAMMALADMYWKGEGVAVDRPEAYCLLFLASQKGAPDAKTRAQTLWKEMSKDDVKRLEKKLRGLLFDPQKVFAMMQAPTTPDTTKGPSQP
jgi:TPR repeat protein